MSKITDQPARWVKSSHSGGDGGQCLEWAPEHAQATGIVPVRDSKAPQRPHLAFSPHAFAAFVSFARGTDA
ncbi:MAG TPA: DUF397 domain-containing protein [Streptomyces sp.]